VTQGRGGIGAHVGLCRWRVSVFSSLSAVTGFLIANSGPGPELLPLALGVFLLACGASALNQYQEREIDALMTRTKTRSLPSGRISPSDALSFAITLVVCGTLVLLLAGSAFAPLLALGAVLWYNGFYTPLKRKTAFAAVPGALVGAIAPAIGWAAGGGGLSDPRLFALCFFFFMWQVPHFWLLLLDRGKEYEQAGLPSMTGIFTEAQLRRIILAWILAAAVSSLFLPFTGIIRTPVVALLLFGGSLWLMAQGIRLSRMHESPPSVPFGRLNVYILLVMLSLSLDRLIV
jgi:protoheme IX farnesyltransferase